MTLPQGWAETTLGEVGVWRGGGTPSKANSAYWTNGTIPWVSPKDMKASHISDAEDYITEAAVSASTTNLVDAGSVLIVVRSGILRRTLPVAITGREVALNQDLKALTPHEGVSAAFIARLLRSRGSEVLHSAAKAGTTVDSLDFERLKQTAVSLPPLAEQRRIVAKLDAQAARIARAREEISHAFGLAFRIRAGALSRAYGGQLSNASSVAYRPCEEWIGSTFYGPRFSKESYVAEGIPTVRTTDFKSDGTMSIEDAPKVFCDKSEFERWGLTDGDLLVTRTGSIGKCAVYFAGYGPVLPSAYLIRVRFTKSLRPRFAWMMFASPQGQAHLGVSARAVTQPNINASAIRSLPIPALSLEQQDATVDRVDAAFARADRLEAEAKKALALIDRLEAAVLAKAFRGELVAQDPNDEPASVLLERIRARRAAEPKPKRGRRPKLAS